MLKRLKQTLVESFVGAIALGLLLSDSITHLASGLVVPIRNWAAQTEFRGFPNRPPQAFLLRDGLPEFVRFFCLLVIWYLLLHWLYLKPTEQKSPPAPETDKESGGESV